MTILFILEGQGVVQLGGCKGGLWGQYSLEKVLGSEGRGWCQLKGTSWRCLFLSACAARLQMICWLRSSWRLVWLLLSNHPCFVLPIPMLWGQCGKPWGMFWGCPWNVSLVHLGSAFLSAAHQIEVFLRAGDLAFVLHVLPSGVVTAWAWCRRWAGLLWQGPQCQVFSPATWCWVAFGGWSCGSDSAF